MKRLILITILILITTNLVFAEINEKYSFKGFPYHGLSFKDRPAFEFNNSEIKGSCFYQEWTEGDATVVKDIFPAGMTGVIFDRCNLVNIYVDETKNTILPNCSTEKIQVQNDWADWIVDDSLKPVEPTSKEQWLEAGVSIDPKDIPVTKMTQEEHDAFKNLLNFIN